MRKGFRKTGRSAKFGIRKVTVPSLSGLTRSQAKTALESVGLTWSETSSTMQNINLDNTIESQGVASGTTVKIGDSVSFSYYLYVAPPPPPPPSGPPSGPPATPPVNPPATPPSGPSVPVCQECVGYVVMNPTCNGEDSYQGYYSAYSRPCYDQYGAYSESTAGCPSGGVFQYYGNLIQANSSSCGGSYGGPPISPPVNPPSTPPADPPIFDGNWYGKSVGVSTLIRTPSGLVRAENLNVGDVLLSADIEGFPYDPSEGVTEQALAWTSENPNIEPVHTTIVNITRRIGDMAVIINGDIFSQYHWILIKRDNVAKFVLSDEIVENSDYVFDPETNTWEIVDLFELIPVSHETISIDCEPYDMFFTEKMLTHDSFSI
jgi:hypothetical protein